MFTTAPQLILNNEVTKIKILHLEDSSDDALLVSNTLKKANIAFEGLVVETKAEFIDALYTFLPDVILSDHSLCAFDSCEALKIFQQTKRTVPFILVTATISEEFAVEILKKGADDYILKDRLSRLPSAIHNALEKFRLKKESSIYWDELIKREKRYHALFENSADGIAILSEKGKPLYVSASIKNILGYTQDEGMELDLKSIAHPADVAILTKIMKQAMDNPGVPVKGDAIRIWHKQKGWRWIEGILTNLLNDPSINGIVDNFRDVTERKEAEQLLIESEQFNKGILASLRSHIAVIDNSGTIISVNKAWEDFAKENKGEAEHVSAGSNYYEVCQKSMADGDDFAGKTLAGIKSVFKKEAKTFNLEYPCHSSVEQRWFAVYVSPFGEDDTKVVISHQNITERKTAENNLNDTSVELEKTLTDLNKILDSSLDVICTINADGAFVTVSAASQNVWGYSPAELVGSKFMKLVYEEDTDITIKAAEKIVSGIPVPIFENRYVHKSGRVVPILWSVNWDKKLRLMFCIAKDVTEKKRLEKAIENERDQFFHMFLKAPSAIGMLKGANHIFEMANPLYLQLIGKKDIIGKTVAEVLPEVVEQGFVRILDNVYRSGESYIGTETLVKVDKEGNGELTDFYMNFIYQAYRNGEGEIEGVFFFINDITGQIESRKELEKSEKFFKGVIESSADMITLFDLAGRIIFTSPEVSKKFGYTYEECLEINIADIVHPDDALIMQEFVMKIIMNPGVPMEGPQIRERKKDGSYIWIDGTLTNFLDTEGINAIIVNFRDVTERKNAETKIRESEFRYRQIVETAQEGIWMLDDNSKTTFVNQKMCEIIGYSSEEMMGKTNFFFKDEADFQTAINALERRRQGISETYKASFITKDGRLIWTQISSNPIFDDAKEYKGSLWMVSDVTEKLMADKMLLESEQMYRKLASELQIERTRLVTAQAVAKVGSWETDLQTMQVSWSDETHRIFETDPHTFIVTHAAFLNLVHTDDRAQVDAALIDSLNKTASSSIEHRIVTANGLEKFVLENWVVVLDGNGVPVSAVGTCQDITERKMAEEGNRFKANLLNTIGQAAVATDLNGIVNYWNKAAEDIYGWTQEEAIGRNIMFLTPSHVTREHALEIMKELKSGRAWSGEFGVQRKDGSDFPALVNNSPIYDQHNKLSGIIGISSDITEKKKLEALLDKSNRLARIGSWEIDIENGTVFWSDITKEIREADPDFIPDLTTGMQMFKEGSHKNTISKRVKDCIEKGIPWDDELQIVTQKGNLKWIRTIGEAEMNNTKCVKVYGSFQDINTRKIAEMEVLKVHQEREVLIHELTRSIKDLKQFSYITSHNFRAPLSNLLGLIGLIDYSDLNASNTETIEMFKTSTLQLNKTINDLIQVLIIRNNVNVDVSFNSIEDLFKETTNSLIYEINDINCDIHTDFSVAEVYFNKLYLDSILLNLLSNAIKYRSPERKLTVNVSTYLNAYGEVELSFADNGQGIDLERAGDRIFGLYQRFHSNRGGEGLGLFIAKSHVTAMGGKIEVKSAVDKGTTFTITFKNPVKNNPEIPL